ncbi:hypothetical protein [Streptomyces sp. TS71-3]|uniref:hypothetical protein n=1 Tax=Streptomyces sp. TS71-3 TaxID=2733862 RepID=UPI001B062BFE|nr:hypothetical protein [Streptomyces sp. TS71-3]GHJ34899.1 hypothetical protein Sm713_05080 [Streptomyces sp. TS71-3]
MSTEIVQLVEQAGPYVTAALGSYGGAVLVRAQDAAVDGTANVGRRVLRAVWQRLGGRDRDALEQAVQDAADDPQDADAGGALRQQIKRALREDAELMRELAALLPAVPAGSVTITASGERSIAAQTIGTAITGDHGTAANAPEAGGTAANAPMAGGTPANAPVTDRTPADGTPADGPEAK